MRRDEYSCKNNRESASTKQYLSSFGAFSRLFWAFSKAEKFAAVDALINSLQNSTALEKKHIAPLQQGSLAKVITNLGIDLSSHKENSTSNNKAQPTT